MAAPEMAEAAINSLNGVYLNGNAMKCSWGRPREYPVMPLYTYPVGFPYPGMEGQYPFYT